MMPIITTPITIDGSSSSTEGDQDLARYGAVNQIINGVFSTINSVLTSDGYTRVDSNTVIYGGDTNNYFYRETYKIGDNEKKYLVFQINSLYLGRGGTNDRVTVSVMLTDSILSTSSSNSLSTVMLRSATITANSTIAAQTVGSDYVVYSSIHFEAYLLEVKNANIALYLIDSSVNLKAFYGRVAGYCLINDDYYVVWNNGANPMFLTAINADGTIYKTQSNMINGYVGVNAENFILTLPIYFATDASTSGVINKDMKLNNTLQTTTNACSYGGIYKINGVDYFAFGNNFLIKL